ncbi:MAG: hypothetical protein JWQ98_1302 [Chlorobi bacterium]|nr:hypothetical protein [Chlorobiota bacterium]
MGPTLAGATDVRDIITRIFRPSLASEGEDTSLGRYLTYQTVARYASGPAGPGVRKPVNITRGRPLGRPRVDYAARDCTGPPAVHHHKYHHHMPSSSCSSRGVPHHLDGWHTPNGSSSDPLLPRHLHQDIFQRDLIPQVVPELSSHGRFSSHPKSIHSDIHRSRPASLPGAIASSSHQRNISPRMTFSCTRTGP